MKIPIILDCDPGVDDALALALAFAREELDVRAVTVVAGNQTLDKTLANALKVLHCLGKKPPVAAGAERPLTRKLRTAGEVHGASGLGNADLALPPWREVGESAWELSRAVILENPQPVTLVPTGPLTNIAILLLSYPEVKKNIARISLMGGSLLSGGNLTQSAEFNIAVDPEAADIVFRSGIPIMMCGLDVTHKAQMMRDEIATLHGHGGRVSLFAAKLLEFYYDYYIAQGFAGTPLHDPCAVAALVAPGLFDMLDCHVDIELKGEFTAGMTVADLRSWSDAQRNATVCMDIQRAEFIQMLSQALMSYP